MQTSGAIIVAVAAAAAGYFSWGVLIDVDESDDTSDSVTSSENFGSSPDLSVPKIGTAYPGESSGGPEGAEPTPDTEAEPEVELPPALIGLDPADYPAKVKLLENVNFSNRDDPSVPPVPFLKEALVVPLKLNGEMLDLTPRLTGSLRATVSYTKTDFLQRVEELKQGGSLAEGGSEEGAEAEAEPEIELIGEDGAIALVKQDIISGRISELKAEQVKKFTYEGLQKVQGEDAEVVLVEFEADTLFGKKRVSARAAIREDKVDRWEWASTGFEMR